MARPKYIILVRHGESQGNCDKSVNRYIPNHKVPLTTKGHQQAADAGQRLKEFLEPDDSILFYTSPYLRARQTLDGLLEGVKTSNCKYKVYEEPRMREQDFGNFQSTAEEMEKIWRERAHYGHFFYRIPYGESAADVFDRCAGFNETLFRQFNTEKFPNVLVLVTHGIWARVFLMKWFRWSVEEFESLTNVPHCAFLIMEKQPNDKYKLLTKLRRWGDLKEENEHEFKQELKKQTSNEIRFNSSVDLSEREVESVVNAEDEALKEQIEKEKTLRSRFLNSQQE
ncbi:unnamed protein product [Kuraishia capsulata CBS 1993]|uniref:Phosphoglycerate mutase-like protein n=1 Tax=Kuraishia capsulata CBS 1993 TaxID=1382522 RepID=W6MKA0_9ASCO|nr:uncharacterized protein KUCA_T00002395001 [Kuraishia capsulata CBS 1993]CDK26423.1 unnamed protein product [Kuraishia capsulata CBS 1993]